MATSEFAGFPSGARQFLADLRDNNTRDWFTANKEAYESELKKPAAQFSAAMCESFEKLTGLPHASRTYRIHRDLRFSKDKTPYNAHLHISFMPQSGNAPPSWHFALEPERLVFGCGTFAFDKVPLEQFRQRVDSADGQNLAALLEKLAANGQRIDAPELKRVPSGYAADHPNADLLRRKGLTVWAETAKTERACDPNFVAYCRDQYKIQKPLFDWLLASD